MPSYIKFSNNDYTLHNDKKIEIDSLYKKCGFKKEENFVKLFSYNEHEHPSIFSFHSFSSFCVSVFSTNG